MHAFYFTILFIIFALASWSLDFQTQATNLNFLKHGDEIAEFTIITMTLQGK